MKEPILYYKDNVDDPTGFKASARKHQSKFRHEQMKVGFVDLYGTKISIDDGYEGMHNFHPLAHNAVKERYPQQRQGLYSDILRSEHIPFNLFAPLNEHKQIFASVLNEFMRGTIKSVDRVVIEYAPRPKVDYLDDATSFDAYIEYTHTQSGKGIIGVELKYTERDYKIGVKETLAVKNSDSPYWNVTRLSNLYKTEHFPLLITDRFRQVWRNQLLGESMKLKHREAWQYSTLAMVYPEGNTHIGHVIEEYKELLLAPNSLSIIPITYNSFLQACDNFIKDGILKEWLDWCTHRYVHQ